MKILISTLFLVTITLGCSTKTDDFTIINCSRDFSTFTNYTIFTRGFTHEGAPVFFSEETQNPLQIRYVIELTAKRDSVVRIEKQFIRDTIKPDEIIPNREKLKDIALEFNKLNIYFLEVDSNKNVFAKLNAVEKEPRIARFANILTIDTQKWKLLHDNWYQEIR